MQTYRVWLLGSALVTLSVIGISCQQPATPQNEASKLTPVPPPLSPVQSAPVVDAPAAAPSPTPDSATEDGVKRLGVNRVPVETTKGMPVNYLVNGDFEEWNGQRAIGWNFSTNEVKRSKEAKDGSYAVQLLALSERYSGLETRLPEETGKELLGKSVMLSAYMKADAPDTGCLQLAYKVGDSPADTVYNAVHPGSGKWELVMRPVEIPDHANPASIKVSVFRRPNGKGDVFADVVKLGPKASWTPDLLLGPSSQ